MVSVPPLTEIDDSLLELSRSALFHLGADFRIVQVSRSVRTLLGYDPQALIGTLYWDIVGLSSRDHLQKCLQSCETVSLDYPLLQATGAQRWVRHSSERQGNSSTIRYACLIQDIDDLKSENLATVAERNLLRTITDNLPVAIHAKNSKHRYIFSNPAHAKLLGKDSPQAVLGQRSEDLLSPELLDFYNNQEDLIITDGQTLITEEHFDLQSDKTRWLHATKIPMRDTTDEIIGVIGLSSDITERKISEQKLAKSRARQSALLDAIPDVMFVINKDYIITEFRASLDIIDLGLHDDCIGNNIKEMTLPSALIDELTLYMNLDLQTHYMQSFEFSKPQVSQTDPHSNHYEARLLKLNAHETLVLIRNITPLKRVQDELKRHIDDLMIVRQVNVELAAKLDFNYVLQLALDAAVRLSNARAGYLALLDDEQPVRKSVIGNYDVQQLDDYIIKRQGIIGRVLANGKAELILNVHTDVDYVPLLAKTTAMIVIPLFSTEQAMGILVLEARKSERFSSKRFEFLQLITGRIAAYLENAKLYHQLQQQFDKVYQIEQLKTQMIRMANHDLKTPLGVVSGYLELIQQDLPDDVSETIKKSLAQSHKAIDEMHDLVVALLSIERIHQLSNGGTHIPLDFSELTRSVIVGLMDFAVSRQHRMPYDHIIKDVMVLGDPLELKEAIKNIIYNAIKYTPDGGNIDVEIQTNGTHTQFRVKDNGYGIPEAAQADLFSPFYRARQNQTAIEGTGLGLYLVKKTIERHNGTVYFESIYQKGSTFGFDIPIMPS